MRLGKEECFVLWGSGSLEAETDIEAEFGVEVERKGWNRWRLLRVSEG